MVGSIDHGCAALHAHGLSKQIEIETRMTRSDSIGLRLHRLVACMSPANGTGRIETFDEGQTDLHCMYVRLLALGSQVPR